MSWQKCPVCNGSGAKPIVNDIIPCKICEGSGILSELTGLPPQKKNKSKSSGDFRDDDNRESQQEYFGQ